MLHHNRCKIARLCKSQSKDCDQGIFEAKEFKKQRIKYWSWRCSHVIKIFLSRFLNQDFIKFKLLILFLIRPGNIWYFVKGSHTKKFSTAGHNYFLANLDRIVFGNFSCVGSKSSIASFEFYLRHYHNQIYFQLWSSMFPANPNCNVE